MDMYTISEYIVHQDLPVVGGGGGDGVGVEEALGVEGVAGKGWIGTQVLLPGISNTKTDPSTIK